MESKQAKATEEEVKETKPTTKKVVVEVTEQPEKVEPPKHTFWRG